MKTWIPIFVAVIAIVVIFAWIEPGTGVFITFAILPYIIAHFIVREDYVESTRHCVTEYLSHEHVPHLLLD